MSEDTHPVLEAIAARRSVPALRPDPVPRDVVERVVRAGAAAPNHYRTEPWRFIVLEGEARNALGNVMAASLRKRLGDESTPDTLASIERERRKPLRAPVIVTAATVPSDRPKVLEIEEIAATAAAVENMLLAAAALGLGAMWRTGPAAYDPDVKRALGLPTGAHIVSFVYLGYPDDLDMPPRERVTEQLVTWLDANHMAR